MRVAPGAPGRPARPGRPGCGSRRPRAWARPRSRPRRARATRGSPRWLIAWAAGRDRRVLHRPVDRRAEGTKDVLEGLLVEGREAPAELDEVAPADRDLLLAGRRRGLEELVVGQVGVAADPEEVLDAALGGQAVVVPAHRVEDHLAAHAPVACDDVGVRVAEHVADVQRARDRRWRRVDRVDLVARGRGVEAVGGLGVPALDPLGLEALDGRPGRARSAWSGGGRRAWLE